MSQTPLMNASALSPKGGTVKEAADQVRGMLRRSREAPPLPEDSLLMIASRRGELEAVRALIPVSDPDARNFDGFSALDIAAQQGHLACVLELIPVSATLGRAGSWHGAGRTALMGASKRGHASCVEALLLVSDPLAKDAAGRDALMLACLGKKEECARALIPASDLGAVDEDGLTAEGIARKLGWELGEQLLRAAREARELGEASDQGARAPEGDRLRL